MPLNLNFHQLLLFHTVATLGSISRAAETLHISQPSISIQLREFEQRWGVMLLRRLPRGVSLTDAGRIVFEHAERVFAIAEELQSVLYALGKAELGPLTVGGSLTAGEYYLPAVSRLYKSRFPGVEPVIVLDNSDGIRARVLRREIDLAFIGTDKVEPELVAVPCWRDEIVVISGPRQRRQGSRTVSLASLQKQLFVMREPGSATRQQVERVLQRHGLVVRTAVTVSSPEAMKRHVMVGLGWSFASLRSVEAELRAGELAVVAVKGWECGRSFCAVYRKTGYLSQAQSNFLEVAKAFGQ